MQSADSIRREIRRLSDLLDERPGDVKILKQIRRLQGKLQVTITNDELRRSA